MSREKERQFAGYNHGAPMEVVDTQEQAIRWADGGKQPEPVVRFSKSRYDEARENLRQVSRFLGQDRLDVVDTAACQKLIFQIRQLLGEK